MFLFISLSPYRQVLHLPRNQQLIHNLAKAMSGEAGDRDLYFFCSGNDCLFLLLG